MFANLNTDPGNETSASWRAWRFVSYESEFDLSQFDRDQRSPRCQERKRRDLLQPVGTVGTMRAVVDMGG